MISGKTALYCLVGDPVAHSLSPLIMNRALELHGCDGVYVACRVGGAGALPALEGMRALGVRGANVTYPLKENVLEGADEVSAAASAIGAANVLTRTGGRIAADNTDAPGVVTALETFGAGPAKGQAVVIFGAGGGARAAAWGLLESGAREVVFAVRDPVKTQGVCDRFSSRFSGRRIDTVALDARGEALDEALHPADIVINATPVGMTGFPESRLPCGDVAAREGQTWFDFVYHPRETPFIATARERGARTVGGLALLVSQAQAGFRLWTGHEFSLTAMYEYVITHVSGESGRR
ncbi:MAG: shikimate dehydrogenase family protein [Candidatus Krumholzibacteriia bacterium]